MQDLKGQRDKFTKKGTPDWDKQTADLVQKSVDARVWVDTSNRLIHKALLTGAFGDGGLQATVEVDITGFDSAVIIPSPPASSTRISSPSP